MLGAPTREALGGGCGLRRRFDVAMTIPRTYCLPPSRFRRPGFAGPTTDAYRPVEVRHRSTRETTSSHASIGRLAPDPLYSWLLGRLVLLQRLADRTVDVQRELDAKPSMVVQHTKASLAGPANVIVDDELVDDLLQHPQFPSAAAHSFNLLRDQRFGSLIVSIGPLEIGDCFLG